MSTDPAADPGPGGFLDAAWRLHPQVAVRPEPFGALLYHFGTRRLSFLKDPAVAAVVGHLAQRRPAGQRSTLRAACRAAGLTDPPPAPVLAALSTLAGHDMLVRHP